MAIQHWVGNNTQYTNSTEPGSGYLGFACLLGSSFLFGSNYIPVKQFETGDGMFFQLFLCIAIWSVGLVVNWIRDFPKFFALPMLGGALWVIGNNNTVPIIKTIGLGLGMLFWNTVGLIVGWANARYGWFGIIPEIPSNTNLNYLGVFFAVTSTFFYVFVKSETKSSAVPLQHETSISNASVSNQNLLDNDELANEYMNRVPGENLGYFDKLNPVAKKFLGISLSIFSGIMYGIAFTPILYARDHYGYSKNNLDYVFSLYTGILLGSIISFAIYCIWKLNKPDVYPEVVMPALVSGWMWGGANILFFIASNFLDQAVSFPIASSGPPIIASLWSILLYGEIKGCKNLIILFCGFGVAILGSILDGMSR